MGAGADNAVWALDICEEWDGLWVPFDLSFLGGVEVRFLSVNCICASVVLRIISWPTLNSNSSSCSLDYGDCFWVEGILCVCLVGIWLVEKDGSATITFLDSS